MDSVLGVGGFVCIRDSGTQPKHTGLGIQRGGLASDYENIHCIVQASGPHLKKGKRIISVLLPVVELMYRSNEK